eukprot:5556593-Amphidinium_carterae.1
MTCGREAALLWSRSPFSPFIELSDAAVPPDPAMGQKGLCCPCGPTSERKLSWEYRATRPFTVDQWSCELAYQKPHAEFSQDCCAVFHVDPGGAYDIFAEFGKDHEGLVEIEVGGVIRQRANFRCCVSRARV